MFLRPVSLLLSLATLIACAPESRHKSVPKQKELIVMGLSAQQYAKAQELGIKIEGDTFLTLKGEQSALDQLKLESFLSDDEVFIEGPKDADIDPQTFYLAKQDFGIPDLLKKYPTYDGRGVIVGGIYDGVSPALSGMRLTTDGKRKILNRTAESDLYKFEVKVIGEEGTLSENAAAYTASYEGKFDKAYEAIADIEIVQDTQGKTVDFNGDEKNENFSLAVFQTESGVTACIDINNDQKVNTKECLKPFSQFGDFTYWNKKTLRELTFEFDIEKQVITLSEGEVSGDAHGEGVATVMTGHKINGRFDGVAPGAQYLDFDLSQRTKDFSLKSVYTVGTFLRALDWMGEQGAEVVNISYSLFFISAQSQEVMRQALNKLVEKHNFVISFSAGNNGPGLGSHNRGAIYPTDSLVVGAFLNKQLDEFVHGVTGLPDQGQVVYYSSIGPGVHGGAGPTVISPLSSLTHAAGIEGYRAFSGTSSAAPALAGAAAVLISAVKQQGLKVDAGAIVHALRQSATPLKGVPFVVQGRGLPKLEKAIEIYKTMLDGKSFKNIEVDVAGKRADKIERKGLVYQLSKHGGLREETISMQGKLARLAPFDSSQDILETIDIEYSHSFLSGASHLWVSAGRSRFFLAVDLEKAREQVKDELFAEITLRSQKTGEVLQIIPVTIINDHVMNKPIAVTTNLSAQSGHRQHINVPVGVQGFSLTIDDRSQLTRFVNAIYYDASRKKAQTIRGLEPGITYFFPVSQPGQGQFTLARFGGSVKDLRIRYKLSPVSLTLVDKEIIDASEVRLINHGRSLPVSFTVKKVNEVLSTKKTSLTASEPLVIEAEIKNEGSYQLKTRFLFEGETTYARTSCVRFKVDKEGKIEKSYFSSSASFSEEEVPGKLTYKCYPFDITGDSTQAGFSVLSSIQREYDSSEGAKTILAPGINAIDLFSIDDFKAESGERYHLSIMPLLDSLNNESSSPIVISDDLKAY